MKITKKIFYKICDNNLISEETEFAKLENLKLLSCNKNQVIVFIKLT